MWVLLVTCFGPAQANVGVVISHSITLFLDRHDPACIVLIGASLALSIRFLGEGEKRGHAAGHTFPFPRFLETGWCPSGTDRAEDQATKASEWSRREAIGLGRFCCG